ncbi:hypothetical protein [Pseudonocardia sp. KRD291]|uniref:hypothetical protein n=1 Tax=Pseudonocardia sp. KRD291 TaxID=2792007 RepID=UPI001C4A1B44|nr:hypothetical protein [Pseudonocardia sp. KRD291]MBW0106594.1 hypothetical protein [Pseudonocardia sp. KRD291]
MTVGNQPSPIGRPAAARGARPGEPRRPALRSPAPGRGPGRSRGSRILLAALVVVVLLAGLGYAGYRQAVGDPEAGAEVSSAGYTVTVPDGWSAAPPGAAPVTVYGVPFTPLAQAPGYPCRDASFARATVAGAQVAVPPGVGVEQAASAFARGAGEALYAGSAPQVAVGPPAPRDGGGSQVEATVRTDGLGGCRATEATVLVVAEPRVTAGDGSTGAALLVVGGDTRGGPPAPEPLTRDTLLGITGTARAAGS